jgi:hypothetical protein
MAILYFKLCPPLALARVYHKKRVRDTACSCPAPPTDAAVAHFHPMHRLPLSSGLRVPVSCLVPSFFRPQWKRTDCPLACRHASRANEPMPSHALLRDPSPICNRLLIDQPASKRLRMCSLCTHGWLRWACAGQIACAPLRHPHHGSCGGCARLCHIRFMQSGNEVPCGCTHVGSGSAWRVPRHQGEQQGDAANGMTASKKSGEA